MRTYSELSDILTKEFNNIDNQSSIFDLVKDPENLYEPIRYAMKQGGKRIRPFLMLLSCEINGGNVYDALYPAIGLEIFHNFTLLHDDIMDKAELRRGQPTVYNKWNTNIAILSGDAMYALAIKFLTQTKLEYIQQILNMFYITSLQICEGQQYDADFEKDENVSIDMYINMIHLKTAVALGAALKIGSFIANKDKTTQDMLYQYGDYIGIAFQLMDDLLDVYGDSNIFGKKIGGDILCCKKTFLYIKALEIADSKTKEALIKTYNETNINPDEKISKVTSLFNRLDIKEETQKIIDHYYNKADNIINKIDMSSESRKALVDYCSSLSHRKF